MVTHDPRAAAIADRILFLADGSDRQGLDGRVGERDHRGDGRAPRLVTRVALRNLCAAGSSGLILTCSRSSSASRSITGTYVLTDSIQGVRLDLHDRLRGHRRRDHRQVERSTLERHRSEAPAVRRVAAVEGAGAARRRRGRRRRRRRGAADRRNGKVIQFGGAPNIGFCVDPTRRAVQLDRRSRTARGPGRRGGDRHGHRARRSICRSATRSPCRARAGAADAIAGLFEFRRGQHRRRDARRVQPPDRSGAVPEVGKLDQIRAAAQAGHLADGARRARSQSILPPAPRCAPGKRRRRRTRATRRRSSASSRASCSRSAASRSSSARS